MLSLLGGIIAIALGIFGLLGTWYGQMGWVYLLKGLIATVPALFILGGCVAFGAGIGSVKDKMRSKEEEKKPEKAPEEKAEEKKE